VKWIIKGIFVLVVTFTSIACSVNKLRNPALNAKYDYTLIEDIASVEFNKFTSEQNNFVVEHFYDTSAAKQYLTLIDLYKDSNSAWLPEFANQKAYRLNVDQDGHKYLESALEDDFLSNGNKASWKKLITEQEVSSFFGETISLYSISIFDDSSNKIIFFGSKAGSDFDFIFEYLIGEGLTKENVFIKDSDGISQIKSMTNDLVYFLGNKSGGELTPRGYSRTLMLWARGKGSTPIFTIPDGAEFPMIWRYYKDGNPHVALNFYIEGKAYMYFSHSKTVSKSSSTYKYNFSNENVFLPRNYDGQRWLARTTLDELMSNKDSNELAYNFLEKPDTSLQYKAHYITNERIYTYFSNDGVIELYAHDLKTLKLLSKNPILTSSSFGRMNPITDSSHPEKLFINIESYENNGSLIYISDHDNSFTPVSLIQSEFGQNNVTIEKLSSKSVDGAQIPYYLVYIGTERPKRSLTLVKPYGGFNQKNLPFYTPENLDFILRGGILVYPGIRGGGEKGKAWHTDGTVLNKKNSFSDLNSVILDLYSRSISKPQNTHLAGTSNGGLVIMATIALYNPPIASAVVTVPIADMVNYTEIGKGEVWIDEYGDPSVQEHYDYLKSYTPVESNYVSSNIPPILIFFSDKDDRVLPVHSIRLFKKLSEMSNKVFIYHNEIGGHNTYQTKRQLFKNISIRDNFMRKVGLEN